MHLLAAIKICCLGGVQQAVLEFSCRFYKLLDDQYAPWLQESNPSDHGDESHVERPIKPIVSEYWSLHGGCQFSVVTVIRSWDSIFTLQIWLYVAKGNFCFVRLTLAYWINLNFVRHSNLYRTRESKIEVSYQVEKVLIWCAGYGWKNWGWSRTLDCFIFKLRTRDKLGLIFNMQEDMFENLQLV